MLSDPDRRALLRIARRTLEDVLAGRPRPDPGDDRRPALDLPRGVFVTLRRDGELRGCIGRLETLRPLAREVQEMALAAARDPRLDPVGIEELTDLRIEISVLTPPRKVASSADVRPGDHGVILTCRGRSAVFLPQVAVEHGWDRPTLLRQLCRKAGLPDDAWTSPDAAFEVFEAEVCGEG